MLKSSSIEIRILVYVIPFFAEVQNRQSISSYLTPKGLYEKWLNGWCLFILITVYS